MKVTVLAVGTKMPEWVEQGVADYGKRITRELGFRLLEVPMARRSKSISIAQCLEREAQALDKHLRPSDYVVALDVAGTALDTPAMARQLQSLRDASEHLVLLIGGPDGLASSCLRRARQVWSLSPLTLPHPLVRVLICEQLYRAVSILAGHPYHRA